MEEKNKCVRAGCSRILWAVLTILLCAAPSFATSEEVPPGVEKDIDYTISGNLTVYGTVNLLSGANITQSVDVKSGGTANLLPGSNIGWFVYTPDTYRLSRAMRVSFSSVFTRWTSVTERGEYFGFV